MTWRRWWRERWAGAGPYPRRMTGSSERHGRRSYLHGGRARTLALSYLAVVGVSAVPFLAETMSGRGEGSFSFLLVMLTTAPLGLALIPVMGVLSEQLGDGTALEGAVLALYVAVALLQAWIIWRIARGPVV